MVSKILYPMVKLQQRLIGFCTRKYNKAELSVDRCIRKYIIHSRDAAAEYLKGRGFIIPYLPLQDIEF